MAAVQSPVLALWAIAFLGVLRIVQDYVVYPRLIRRGLSLHPLAVIVAVLAGAELGGIAGVFLAVPAVAVVSVVIRHVLAWRAEDVPLSSSRSPVDVTRFARDTEPETPGRATLRPMGRAV